MDKTHEMFGNAPYEVRRCTRCGKHIDELEAFGEEAGEFAGYKLIKTHRWFHIFKYNEEYEQILEDIGVFGLCEELYSFYGKQKVDWAISYEEGRNWTEKSLECKSCIYEEGDFKHY